jgi:hypothetical protein
MKMRKLEVNFVKCSEGGSRLLPLDMPGTSTGKLRVYSIKNLSDSRLSWFRFKYFIQFTIQFRSPVSRFTYFQNRLFFVQLEQVRLLVAPIVPHIYTMSTMFEVQMLFSLGTDLKIVMKCNFLYVWN